MVALQDSKPAPREREEPSRAPPTQRQDTSRMQTAEELGRQAYRVGGSITQEDRVRPVRRLGTAAGGGAAAARGKGGAA